MLSLHNGQWASASGLRRTVIVKIKDLLLRQLPIVEIHVIYGSFEVATSILRAHSHWRIPVTEISIRNGIGGCRPKISGVTRGPVVEPPDPGLGLADDRYVVDPAAITDRLLNVASG